MNAVGCIIMLLLTASPVVYLCLQAWWEAQAAADYSDHASLTKQILYDLEHIPPGQPYPASLQLSPEYGGSPLLNRFEYHSNGVSCTVRTMLHDREVFESFPKSDRPK